MSSIIPRLSVAFVLALGMPVASPAQDKPAAPVAVPTPTGELQLSVVVVDELTPKPVPLTPFKITPTADPDAAQTVKTDVEGKIDVPLAPGKYTVESVRPLEFKNHTFVWKADVTVEAGKTAKLDWTDADAMAEAAKPARQVSDEANIYKMRKSGVVTVEGDFGSGSGFVVDPRGLILTNAHVVGGGRWAAVRFDKGIRVPAVVVEQDKDADVAVVCVNPDAYKDFSVVPLADASAGPLAVEGEKVLTIGSPLNQEKVLTIGIVSKVEKDYLVSDININHGNSGGPLLNMAGDAVGLTTFLDSAENGPGISGIVSVTKALPVLERARQKMTDLTLPAAERLPDVSPVPIPEESLTAVKLKDVKPYSEGKPKNFETRVVTPFYLGALQAEYDKNMSKEKERRVKKRGKEGVKDELAPAPSAFWERYALHTAAPVIAIEVRPTLKIKSSSRWGSLLGAVVGVNVPVKQEFRDDFWDMALYRGDTLVHPVRRQRENVAALYADDNIQVNDTATGGIYFYDPSVFAPGEKLTLYVRRESDLSRWDTVPLKESEQEKIYKMFLPYRSALAQSGGDETVRGLSATIHTPPSAGADWTPETAEASARVSQAVTPQATPAAAFHH